MGRPSVMTLLVLAELVAADAGFRIRGVCGWALPSQIEPRANTWATADIMRAHVRMGRAITQDVRAPGETRPQWVYRVTQLGLDMLSSAVGVWPAGVCLPSTDSEDHVLLREGVVVALDALKSSMPSACIGRIRIYEDRRWCSARELSQLLVEEDEATGMPPRSFMSEDLRWLVRHALAERRVVNRTYLYRITPAGLQVKPLVWTGLS